MKTKEVPLDTTQDVELTVYQDYQARPLTITGPYEAIEPIAAHVQALDARTPVRTTKLGKAIVAAPETPQTLDGRRASIAARMYDMVNGSNMYELLKQRRAEERDLAMARRLGLVSTVYCQKHERELAKVRGLGVE